MVRSFLNSYFGFNRQQRNGLMVLLAVSFILLAVRITYPFFLQDDDIEVKFLPLTADTIPEQDTITRFPFDPNTATAEQLIQLGLTERTAATVIKYRKGHPFTVKEDLQKVYGISPQLYKQLSPYVVIAEQKSRTQRKNFTTAKGQSQPSRTVELNGADSAALESLPGIGGVFAQRIIKYRAMLGGFTSKSQLHEVYGITPEAYDRISDHVTVQSSAITKINLNTDDFKTVNRHPYISYELTKTIFNERRKKTLGELSVRSLCGDSLYEKLAPYLSY